MYLKKLNICSKLFQILKEMSYLQNRHLEGPQSQAKY